MYATNQNKLTKEWDRYGMDSFESISEWRHTTENLFFFQGGWRRDSNPP